jgi:Ca-activated chloride channel family protein
MSDLRFESPRALQWLWLVPLIYFMTRYWAQRAKADLSRVLGTKLEPLLTASLSVQRRVWKERLEILIMVLFIVCYARPQTGEGKQTVKNEGVEVMFLFDVSNSMMSEDVRPSRLQFAKNAINHFIELSNGDRMGLVAFAGSAALLSPMTSDQDAIKMYIESLSTDSVSTQGTNFSKALKEAHEAFSRGGLGEQEGSRVTRAIVIVSDGEDNEPGANDEAEALAKEGIHIFSIAVGTEQGGAIPMRDDQGQVRGYKRDKSGQVIMTKTNGAPLKDLAKLGQGSFYHASYESDVIKAVRGDIEKLQKSQFESGEVRSYNERYQPLLFVALILALVEIILGERRGVGRLWRGRFEVQGE